MRLILLLVISFSFSGLALADSAKGKTYPTTLVPAVSVKPEPKVIEPVKKELVCVWRETKTPTYSPGSTYVTQGIFIPGCSSCCGNSTGTFLPGSFYQDHGQSGWSVKLETVCY